MRAHDPRRRRARRRAAALLALAPVALRPAFAESGALAFTPSDTQIRFEVEATMHQVVGTARLLRGELRFDEAAGRASGSMVVDARSADTDNGLRDATLHGEVLESERYPEIVFLPESLRVVRSSPDRAQVELGGRLRIHGGEHALTIPAQIERRGNTIRLSAHFRIPYVEWGLRDESKWLLKVAPEAEVFIDALASYRADAAATAPQGAGAAP